MQLLPFYEIYVDLHVAGFSVLIQYLGTKGIRFRVFHALILVNLQLLPLAMHTVHSQRLRRSDAQLRAALVPRHGPQPACAAN